MQRVKPMININEIRRRYRREKYSRYISDQAAFDFIELIDAGESIDTIFEIMDGVRETRFDDGINNQLRRSYASKLIRSPIVRTSALFCALLGVDQQVLAEFNRIKTSNIREAEVWLQINGYAMLRFKKYTDCIQAWSKPNSVAKVQKLPSGKFLVQEFKIV